MEKVLTNETGKLLLVLGMGLVGLTALMAKLVSRLRGSFRPYQKSTIIYLLVAIVFFSLIAATAHPAIFIRPLPFFIFYQVYFLFFGIVHFYYMHDYLRWSGDDKSFWLELLFTMIISALGAIGFIGCYRFFNGNGLEWIMAASISVFLVPFFLYHTFQRAVSIPPKIVRRWLYPVHEEIADPEESKLRNMLIISFEFQKQSRAGNYTNFRAKAPTDMEFGQLFYYFINDYNDRHPDNKIEYLESSGVPQGWIFYKKPRWHSIFTRYIDTGKTVFMNHVRENDIIICARSN